ncbi:MAG: hypothetical protein U0441_38055 [Polyangiaceae bacterium]
MKALRSKGIAAVAISIAAALAGCSASAPPAATPAKATANDAASAAKTGAAEVPFTQVVMPVEDATEDPIARRLAAEIDGARPPVKAYPIDLTALPKVTVQPLLDAKSVVKLDARKLTEDTALQVKPAEGYARQYMLGFSFREGSGATFANVSAQSTYGAADGWLGEGFGSATSMYLTCSAAPPALVPVHVRLLKVDGGRVTFTMVEDVLDRAACKLLTVSRTEVQAKPLLPGGVLYGLRACVGSCAEDDEITLLFPRSNATSADALGGGAALKSGAFTTVSIPLARGGGGAFVSRVFRRDMEPWRSGMTAPEWLKNAAPSDRARVNAMFLTSFNLGVEVSQASADEAAVAIAYMDIDPAALAALTAPPAPAVPKPAPTSPQANGPEIVNPFLDRR